MTTEDKRIKELNQVWRNLLDARRILETAERAAGNGMFTTGAEYLLRNAQNYLAKQIREIRAEVFGS